VLDKTTGSGQYRLMHRNFLVCQRTLTCRIKAGNCCRRQIVQPPVQVLANFVRKM
jgi:hypothetical protein